MFFSIGVARVIAVVVALILIGLALMNTDTLFILVGALAVVTGVGLLFFSLRWSLCVLPVGAAMLGFGITLRRRLEREQIKQAEETARRVSGLTDLHFPREK